MKNSIRTILILSVLTLLVVLGCGPAVTPASSPDASCTAAPAHSSRTVSAALVLARAVVVIVAASCGDKCPPELASVADTIKRAEATQDDVCKAIVLMRTIPCSHCVDRLDAASALAGCDGV
jgi:hypothetical protein